jgi:hypothetical protein
MPKGKPKKPFKKANHAEVEQRINQVFMLLLQGEPREKIFQFSAQNWGITDRQCATYIKRATARMRVESERERKIHHALAIAQRNNLYRLAYRKEKLFTCLQVLDSRDRILGLFEDINLHIEIVEQAGFVVRDPRLETEDSDPAGELFAAVEAGETGGAETAAPDAGTGMESETEGDISADE